jgi:SNF2 family DNA or RNA helicase
VICPASLVYNWKAEFSRFAPELEVEVVEGAKSHRAAVMEARADVFVMSYDIARIDAAQLAEREFFAIVLDEAQYIKNHATATTKAIKTFSAAHRIALTGTPIENRLSEVWSIFDFLMPGFLGSYQRFRDQFETAAIAGDEEVAARLAARISPFILRRRKADVLKDLPEKLEQTVYVPMGPKQRRLYLAREQALKQTLSRQDEERKAGLVRKSGEAKLEVLTELMRLRQIALDPALLYEDFREPSAKTDAIIELVDEAREAGEKVLVFSQFTSYLETLGAKLDELGIAHYTITGKTPKRTRLDLVNAFNSDDVPVFLVSLKAGGTGLNLTGASVVIHADPWWNAAATNQATDRAHRIGQKRDVSVYKVIAKDTVEERILKLQDAKSELAESVVGGADGLSLARMSSEDLLDLLED